MSQILWRIWQYLAKLHTYLPLSSTIPLLAAIPNLMMFDVMYGIIR